MESLEEGLVGMDKKRSTATLVCRSFFYCDEKLIQVSLVLLFLRNWYSATHF